jgi:hypothetical protein
MNRTKACDKFRTDAIPSYIEEIALGTISVSDLNCFPLESQVIMSEKNFRFLLALIPKISTHNALNNEITGIKDKLTELVMTPGLNRQMIADLLTDQANRQTFLADVEELNKLPMIVGEIDLEKDV